MINVALPKGRLGEKVYDIFERIGYDCPSIKEKSRKLLRKFFSFSVKVKHGKCRKHTYGYHYSVQMNNTKKQRRGVDHGGRRIYEKVQKGLPTLS